MTARTEQQPTPNHGAAGEGRQSKPKEARA